MLSAMALRSEDTHRLGQQHNLSVDLSNNKLDTKMRNCVVKEKKIWTPKIFLTHNEIRFVRKVNVFYFSDTRIKPILKCEHTFNVATNIP